MKHVTMILILALALLCTPFTGLAADINSITVTDQGQEYRIPMTGWNFQRRCGTGMCPVKDLAIVAKLARTRDGFKQKLDPEIYALGDLSRVLGKLRTASERKYKFNQFDKVFTNAAAGGIGFLARSSAGDPTAIGVVLNSITTVAAAGSELSRKDALDVGLYFADVAVQAGAGAADFQSRYFAQNPVGWTQLRPMPLSELEKAAGQAHEALRLSAPAAALMTKVTYRDGGDTWNSFKRNTCYAMIPAGNEVLSVLDSAEGFVHGGIVSAKALKVFHDAIETGRANPFDTDLGEYRNWAVHSGGFKDEPQSGSVDELLRVAEQDMRKGRFTQPENDNAFDKYRKVLNISPRNPQAIAGLDRILVEYDRKMADWRDNPVEAGGYCREVRQVLVNRWQTKGFSDRNEFREWNRQYKDIDECLEPDLPEKLIGFSAFDVAEEELNDRVQHFDKILRLDWIGEIWGDPEMVRKELGKQVAEMRLKILEGRNKKNAPPAPKTKVGRSFVEAVTGMEFVWVPGGCFEMGTNNGDSIEKPVHEVCVDGYWMGKTEVTQGQWRKIMGSNPSHFKKGDNYPVEQVSWDDAQEYIKKLSSVNGKSFRLPTEAEWEYAARSGGKDEKYPGGNELNALAWYRGNSDGSPHPVAQKKPNGFQLYDMGGNLREWCQDRFDWHSYENSSRKNPQGPLSGSSRMLRGGSWINLAWDCRSTFREWNGPGYRYGDIGFRLVHPAGQ